MREGFEPTIREMGIEEEEIDKKDKIENTSKGRFFKNKEELKQKEKEVSDEKKGELNKEENLKIIRKEISEKEKSEIIKEYIKKIKHSHEETDFFLESDVKQFLKEEEFNIIFKTISERNNFENNFKNQISEKMKEMKKEEAEEFEKFVIRKIILRQPEQTESSLSSFFSNVYKQNKSIPEKIEEINKEIERINKNKWWWMLTIGPKNTAEIKKKTEQEKKQYEEELEYSIEQKNHLLEKFKEEIEPSKKNENKENKNPIKIIGFEKLNLPNIKGEEALKRAEEIFPNGFITENVKTIEYLDEDPPPGDKQYGFEANTFASYSSYDKKIKIYRKENAEKNLEDLPNDLSHEFFHSLDPQSIDQKEIPLIEQFRIIKEWEKIREEDPVEITSYVKAINNEDKSKEKFLKQKEDWAESGAIFLNNPCCLYLKSKKRYKFMENFLKKYFSYSAGHIEQLKKVKKYHDFLNSSLKENS